MKWVVAVMLIGAASAEAGMLDVVSGGPRGLEASLSRLEPAVGVCFATGRARGAVKVKLQVAASGAVVKASPLSRGAVAQCVAGVMAVQRVKRARRGYAATIRINPAGGSAVRLKAAIKKLRPSIDRCLERVAGSRSLRGKLAIRFTIESSGSVSRPEIVADTVGDRGARRCLSRVVGKARLPRPPRGKPLSYTLPIAVDVSGGRRTTPARQRSGLRPRKRGPVSTAAITAVMNKHKRRFSKCYERVARHRRDLRGHVTLRFTIRDSGRVTNVKVRKTTLKSPGVESCLVKVARRLRFSKRAGRAPTRVFYPLSFAPK